MRGEAYTGKKYADSGKAYTWEEKAPKSMGTRCDCNAVFAQCKEISEEERKEIFNYIWSISWPEKKVYVASMVSVTSVGKRKVVSEQYRRNTSMTYRLKSAARYLRVCKQMFLSTTGLTDYFIRTYARPLEPQVPEAPKQKQTSMLRESVRKFIGSLPKMPSHYCRRESSKMYMEPLFSSYLHLFSVYEDFCKSEKVKAATRKVFMDELNVNNVSIFRPKKDMCDTCLSFETGNLDEATYQEHRRAKDRARYEMAKDIEDAVNSKGKTRVLTMDLQCVLLCPSIQASALYYRTKLCVHNFTVFDCNSHETRCYVWHEAEGGLSAQEFASCLYDFLSSDTSSSCEKYVIYSDGCTYQNRNVTMGKAMSSFAQANNKEVQQKFLVKGHMQMEVDSVHSCIQRAIGKQAIHSPSDYVKIMKAARRSKCPYDVKYLNHPFFKDFTNISSLKSIRPGKKAGEPVVTDIRAIKYTSDGEITTKLHLDGNWQPLPMKRAENTLLVQDPAPLHRSRRAIPATNTDTFKN